MILKGSAVSVVCDCTLDKPLHCDFLEEVGLRTKFAVNAHSAVTHAGNVAAITAWHEDW